MYARQLFKAAQIIGLSQGEIARQLNVSRSLTSLWARNKYRVPQNYRETLVRLVSTAAQARLTSAAQTLGAMAWEGDSPEVKDLKSRLSTLRDAWEAENLDAMDIGPTASIHAALEALDVYKGMEKATLRKADNLSRLHALATSLHAYTTLLTFIGPLENIIEKDTSNGNNSHDSARHPDEPEATR